MAGFNSMAWVLLDLKTNPEDGAGPAAATGPTGRPALELQHDGAESDSTGSQEGASADAKPFEVQLQKSRCLKLYCQCFASGRTCDPAVCKCHACMNTDAHHDARQDDPGRARAQSARVRHEVPRRRRRAARAARAAARARARRDARAQARLQVPQVGGLKKYCEAQANVLLQNCVCIAARTSTRRLGLGDGLESGGYAVRAGTVEATKGAGAHARGGGHGPPGFARGPEPSPPNQVMLQAARTCSELIPSAPVSRMRSQAAAARPVGRRRRARAPRARDPSTYVCVRGGGGEVCESRKRESVCIYVGPARPRF